jgi:hypothetical protein
LFAGEPAAAREHSDAGRQLYDPERHRSHRLLYGGHEVSVIQRHNGQLPSLLVALREKNASNRILR